MAWLIHALQFAPLRPAKPHRSAGQGVLIGRRRGDYGTRHQVNTLHSGIPIFADFMIDVSANLDIMYAMLRPPLGEAAERAQPA